jgi:hypothetical protein
MLIYLQEASLSGGLHISGLKEKKGDPIDFKGT